MTVMLRKSAHEGLVWSTMPGWGIVADLTPPELVAARSLRTLRRVIAGIVVLVIVLCGAGVFLAQRSESAANDALAAAQDHTTTLRAQKSKYVKVTQIEAAINAATAQQASLMATDVDTAKLANAIAKATPAHVHPSSINISLTGAAGASTSSDASGAASLSIGTVTMTGSATTLDDLADFVSALNATSGFSDVVPTSNTRTSNTRTSWAVTFQLTPARYSKRFTAQTSTGTTKPTGGS